MKPRPKEGACVRTLRIYAYYARRLEEDAKQRTFHFKEGVNILCGPNGSGKSTLLEAIEGCAGKGNERPTKIKAELVDYDPGPFKKFDFEKDNPRCQNIVEAGGFAQFAFGMRAKFSSHGETTRELLRQLMDGFERACVLIDEPEQALDMQGLHKLVEQLKASKARQIIIASHSPNLILDPGFNVVELEEGYRTKVGLNTLALGKRILPW